MKKVNILDLKLENIQHPNLQSDHGTITDKRPIINAKIYLPY